MSDDDEGDLVNEIAAGKAKWQAGNIKAGRKRDKVGATEAKLAAGFTKIGGKHVAADGLVSRRGYRRIIPNAGTDPDWLEYRAEQLAEIASKVLHGRNATIFEARVIAPLKGLPKWSVEDLAKQFGVTPKRIYR